MAGSPKYLKEKYLKANYLKACDGTAKKFGLTRVLLHREMTL
jgi:hypothetical protein